jgi:hypothetical protein
MGGVDGIHTAPDSPYALYYDDAWEATFEEAARQEVRFLLTGAGGDHICGADVPSYTDLLLTGQWASLFQQVRGFTERSGIGWIPAAKLLLLGPLREHYLWKWRPSTEPVPWLTRRYHGLFHEHFGAKPGMRGTTYA